MATGNCQSISIYNRKKSKEFPFGTCGLDIRSTSVVVKRHEAVCITIQSTNKICISSVRLWILSWNDGVCACKCNDTVRRRPNAKPRSSARRARKVEMEFFKNKNGRNMCAVDVENGHSCTYCIRCAHCTVPYGVHKSSIGHCIARSTHRA